MTWWKKVKIFRRSKSHGPSSSSSADRNITNANTATYEPVVLPRTSPRTIKRASSVAESSSSSRRAVMMADDDADKLLPDYYYPNMDKDGATDALRHQATGTFLLRRSQSPSAACTLSVRSERHVFNVRILKNSNTSDCSDGGTTKNGGSYHLDGLDRSCSRPFPNVAALVSYYSGHPRELITVCGVDEQFDTRTSFELLHPLRRRSADGGTLSNSVRNNTVGGIGSVTRTPARSRNNGKGGSLKLMRQWL